MRSRFTIVEMMIVVAIILVLAAIAIPAYSAYSMRAKRAECAPMVADIRVANLAYHAATDQYRFANAWMPDGSPGKTLRTWTVNQAYRDIGFAPDGQVRGSYHMTPESQTCCAYYPGPLVFACIVGKEICFCGMTDIDNDGQPACYYSSVAEEVATITNDRYF